MGWKAQMITTPYRKEYFDNIPSEEWDKMRKAALEVAEKFQVNYHDDSQLAEISNNQKYFMNTDHLNKAGALVYTEFVLQRD